MRNSFIYLTLILFFISPKLSLAQNNEIERQKELIKGIEQEIKFLDNQILQTREKHKNSLSELVLIQKKVTSRESLINEIDREIKLQEAAIKSKTLAVKEIESRLDTLNYYYKSLVINAYKNRDNRVWFMYIIASDNIEQGYRRWSYLKNYTKNINKQAQKIKDTKAKLVRERVVLTNLRSTNLKNKQSREREYNLLKEEEQSAKKMVTSLASKQRVYSNQLSQKKSQATKLNKEVERLIAEAIRQEELRKAEEARKKAEAEKREKERLAAIKRGESVEKLLKEKEDKPIIEKEPTPKPTSKPKIATNIPKLTGTFTANKGKLPRPVQGVVIEYFGAHSHPTLKGVQLPYNNGINISASRGAEVINIFEGIVKQVIAMPGYNMCVLIQHGNYFTFYCKLDRVDVIVGQKIAIGTVIGNLAIKDNTSELHFELWNGTTKQNPQLWLRKN